MNNSENQSTQNNSRPLAEPTRPKRNIFQTIKAHVEAKQRRREKLINKALGEDGNDNHSHKPQNKLNTSPEPTEHTNDDMPEMN